MYFSWSSVEALLERDVKREDAQVSKAGKRSMWVSGLRYGVRV